MDGKYRIDFLIVNQGGNLVGQEIKSKVGSKKCSISRQLNFDSARVGHDSH